MQTKFKRHQKVRILVSPNTEYIEYHEDNKTGEIKDVPIIKGMIGKINMLLPNGQYHVEIDDKKGDILAYALFSEEELESLED